jgi:glucose-1-phosphate thymidylyltransferase
VTLRAVVLARGLGTRMQSPDTSASLSDDQRRAADAGMKAMMPIGGRPFLDYVLSAIADGGIGRVALVVAPEHAELLDYYRTVAPPSRIRLDFVVQRQPLGTADAVLAAEGWTDSDAFLVMNGDNLYPPAVVAAMAAADQPALAGFTRQRLIETSNIDPSRINAFALAESDAEGHLTRIVEKPAAAEAERAGPDARVSMNCWRFDSRIFPACRDVPRSPRGELELPAAVALAMSRGVRFRVVPVDEGVLDLSQRADAAALTRRLAGAIPSP